MIKDLKNILIYLVKFFFIRLQKPRKTENQKTKNKKHKKNPEKTLENPKQNTKNPRITQKKT